MVLVVFLGDRPRPRVAVPGGGHANDEVDLSHVGHWRSGFMITSFSCFTIVSPLPGGGEAIAVQSQTGSRRPRRSPGCKSKCLAT